MAEPLHCEPFGVPDKLHCRACSSWEAVLMCPNCHKGYWCTKKCMESMHDGNKCLSAINRAIYGRGYHNRKIHTDCDSDHNNIGTVLSDNFKGNTEELNTFLTIAFLSHCEIEIKGRPGCTKKTIGEFAVTLDGAIKLHNKDTDKFRSIGEVKRGFSISKEAVHKLSTIVVDPRILLHARTSDPIPLNVSDDCGPYTSGNVVSSLTNGGGGTLVIEISQFKGDENNALRWMEDIGKMHGSFIETFVFTHCTSGKCEDISKFDSKVISLFVEFSQFAQNRKGYFPNLSKMRFHNMFIDYSDPNIVKAEREKLIRLYAISEIKQLEETVFDNCFIKRCVDPCRNTGTSLQYMLNAKHINFTTTNGLIQEDIGYIIHDCKVSSDSTFMLKGKPSPTYSIFGKITKTALLGLTLVGRNGFTDITTTPNAKYDPPTIDTIECQISDPEIGGARSDISDGVSVKSLSIALSNNGVLDVISKLQPKDIVLDKLTTEHFIQEKLNLTGLTTISMYFQRRGDFVTFISSAHNDKWGKQITSALFMVTMGDGPLIEDMPHTSLAFQNIKHLGIVFDMKTITFDSVQKLRESIENGDSYPPPKFNVESSIPFKIELGQMRAFLAVEDLDITGVCSTVEKIQALLGNYPENFRTIGLGIACPSESFNGNVEEGIIQKMGGMTRLKSAGIIRITPVTNQYEISNITDMFAKYVPDIKTLSVIDILPKCIMTQINTPSKKNNVIRNFTYSVINPRSGKGILQPVTIDISFLDSLFRTSPNIKHVALSATGDCIIKNTSKRNPGGLPPLAKQLKSFDINIPKWKHAMNLWGLVLSAAVGRIETTVTYSDTPGEKSVIVNTIMNIWSDLMGKDNTNEIATSRGFVGHRPPLEKRKYKINLHRTYLDPFTFVFREVDNYDIELDPNLSRNLSCSPFKENLGKSVPMLVHVYL